MHKGDPPFDIQLRLEGYLPQTRSITSDESVKMVVSLAKVPVVAPKTEEAKPEPSKVPVTKVSNVSKTPRPPKPPKVPKKKVPDPIDNDGIIQPDFGK
jgi:hypothetical protein